MMAVYDISGGQLNAVYNRSAVLQTRCYDVSGNELAYGFTLVVNDDASEGTSSGHSLTSAETAKQYVLRMVVNFMSDSGAYQAFCYDYDNGLFYKFDSSTTVKVYNSSMELVDTITMPQSAGHTNDSCYYNGGIYLPGGYMGATVAEGNKLYVWDIANNAVNSISLHGIPQPSNGSTRNIWGVCQTDYNSGKLYLVCIDVTSSELVHDENDKLSIYEYNLSSGVCALKAEFTWDCVYVQGATCLNGILYVACNTQTTGSPSNYLGITLKSIRTDTWEMIDELTVSGSFEPEGMDAIPVGTGYQLMMGMGKWNEMEQAVRFTAPYKLVAE